MSDLNDVDDAPIVEYLVNDSIIPDSDSIGAQTCYEFDRPERTRVVHQSTQDGDDLRTISASADAP
jgi:hypothetical protein